MRSFIAIELPDTVTSALAELQQEFIQNRADIRWVKPDNIHLTLKFLGNINEEDTDEIRHMIEGTCNNHHSFNLELKGTGVFPHIKSPRILWVGISSNETLLKLKRDIEDGMSSLGFEKENRIFSPHLTLGRFRSSPGKGSLSGLIESHAGSSFGSMEVKSVYLMRSDLGPSGARYTKIAEGKLANE